MDYTREQSNAILQDKSYLIHFLHTWLQEITNLQASIPITTAATAATAAKAMTMFRKSAPESWGNPEEQVAQSAPESWGNPEEEVALISEYCGKSVAYKNNNVSRVEIIHKADFLVTKIRITIWWWW